MESYYENNRYKQSPWRNWTLFPGLCFRKFRFLKWSDTSRPVKQAPCLKASLPRLSSPAKMSQAVVEAGGASGIEKVVKTTCFLADMADFAAFNDSIRRSSSQPSPHAAALPLKELPKGALCEIEAISRACNLAIEKSSVISLYPRGSILPPVLRRLGLIQRAKLYKQIQPVRHLSGAAVHIDNTKIYTSNCPGLDQDFYSLHRRSLSP